MRKSAHLSRRRLLQSSAAALSLGGYRQGFAQATPSQQANARFGINFDGISDWNTEQPFANVFRSARPWQSFVEGGDPGSGPTLDVDEFGWVRRIEEGCYAQAMLLTIWYGHYPGGIYTVLYDGEGHMDFSNNVSVRSRRPGRIVIDVDSSDNGPRIELRATNPENYVRNIRVLMPGLEDRDDSQPFRPNFLDRWRGVAGLRFMDWMATSNSPIQEWSERPTLEHGTFMDRGVPVEVMINLANELHADPWFCIPHMASDGYVRNFAAMVRDGLADGLKAYVEYSNEVWNTIYNHFDYAARRAASLEFGANGRRAVARYVAHRSVEIFDIFEQEFGSTDRLVRVLPSQAATPDLSEQILEFRGAHLKADALTIAPYMGCNVHNVSGDVLTADFEKWSVDQALDFVEQTSLPRAIRSMREQRDVADRFGVKLVAYEAGQHMAPIGAANQNERVNELIHEANLHPRMGEIYDRYYQAWTEIGGDLMCHYSSVRLADVWGSWGLLNYSDQTADDCPKYAASVRWARSRGQAMEFL